MGLLSFKIKSIKTSELIHLYVVYRVYLCKAWQDLKIFNDHTAMATGVRFGRNARYIASTSMDRTLKIYGLI